MKHSTFGQLAIAIVLNAAFQATLAAQTDNEQAARIEEIAESIRSFAGAFNAGNAGRVAAHFADDGEYVDDAETLFKGRKDIEAEFAAFFKAAPDCQLAIDVEDIRFIGKEMAVEEGVAAVTQKDDDSVTVSRYVVIHVKGDDGWKIASLRDLDSEPASNHDRLKALEWMIGDWIDEGKEATVETSVRWSNDGNFIISKFQINLDGVRVMYGTQRIGWDPQKKQIRSWVFDSEGGFGSGRWTETEAGWIVKTTFVLPDGGSGSATSTYAVAGSDAFRLTLSQRLVKGEPLPNLKVNVVRRPPETAK
jgi:uncharacterized protein (TIGR02246 family)